MEGPSPNKKKHVVAFAQDSMADSWRAAQVHDLKNALAQYPDIEFIYTDARGDIARLVQDIEDLAAKGVDVLVTSPPHAEQLREPIARVYRRGIPVILLTRRVNGEEFTQFIAPDNHAIARQAARYLARRLKGQGRILMLQGVPASSSANERTEGFLQELTHWPGLKVAAIKPANYQRVQAILRVEEALDEKIGFDAIYAQSDSMALGAVQALQKAGLDPQKIPITGVYYVDEARAAIRAGAMDASFRFPTIGKESAAAIVRLLRNGKPAKKLTVVDSILVTHKNVERVEPVFWFMDRP